MAWYMMLDFSQNPQELPKLKHLRLHELPKLYEIVSVPWTKRPTIYAPNLETVKIRGCCLLEPHGTADGWRRQGGELRLREGMVGQAGMRPQGAAQQLQADPLAALQEDHDQGLSTQVRLSPYIDRC
jgi:hypothetical protein